MLTVLKIKSFEATLNLNIFALLFVIFIFIINDKNLNATRESGTNFNDYGNFHKPSKNGQYRRAAKTSPQTDEKSPDNHHTSMTADYAAELLAQLLPKKYNKNLRPNFGGPPIVTSISLRIRNINAVSETKMESEVDCVVRHYWKDPRLAFPIRYNIKKLSLGEEFAKKIWLPDMFISNGRETVTQKTVSAGDSTLLRIAHDGEILYSTRLMVTTNCPMDLTYFPLDQQKCSIILASYGLSDQEIAINWANNRVPIEISSDINLPTFQLRGYNRHKCVSVLGTGNFTELIFDMVLARSIGFYVLQVYIPAFLIVVISWVPFWLDRDESHARVALGVTTVLTMTTLITKTNSDFPKISHLKAIDVYLFTCFLMVFASLFEYATVGYFEFKRVLSGANDGNQGPNCQSINKRQTQMEPSVSSTSADMDIAPNDAQDRNRAKRMSLILRRLIHDTSIMDNWARWAFPTIFVVFNLTYAIGLATLAHLNDSNQQYEVKLI